MQEMKSEHWHVAEDSVGLVGRKIIRDENRLFVAEVVESDAELVAMAPRMAHTLVAIVNAVYPPDNPKAEHSSEMLEAIEHLCKGLGIAPDPACLLTLLRSTERV